MGDDGTTCPLGSTGGGSMQKLLFLCDLKMAVTNLDDTRLDPGVSYPLGQFLRKEKNGPKEDTNRPPMRLRSSCCDQSTL